MSSIQSEVYNGIKWNSLSSAIVALFKLLQVAVLTRFLEKSDFGLVGIALLFNNFSNIFVQMGFSTVVIHEKQMSNEAFSSLYWANIIVGFAMSLTVALTSPIIASYYHNPELIGVISLTSLMIFTGSVSSLQQTVQLKKMNFKFINIINVLSILIVFFLNVILALNNFGVYSLVWSSIAGSLFVSIVYLYMGFFYENNIKFKIKFREIKNALNIGAYQMGSSALDFLSREMDSIIISSYFSMSLFGVYTLCKNLSLQIYSFFNPIITNVLTPTYAKIQDETSRIIDIYIKSINYIGLVNYYIYGVIIIGSSQILCILYGESYSQYSIVLIGLAFYYAQLSLGNPIGSLIIATGRTDLGFYWTVFRIFFVFIYLQVFSYTNNITVFMSALAVLPLLTHYPNWYICLRHLIKISFFKILRINVVPLVITISLLPICFAGRMVSNIYISFFLVYSFFTISYILVYFRLRKSLTYGIYTAIHSFVNNRF